MAYEKGDRVEVRSNCGPARVGTVLCRVGWITYAVEFENGTQEDLTSQTFYRLLSRRGDREVVS